MDSFDPLFTSHDPSTDSCSTDTTATTTPITETSNSTAPDLLEIFGEVDTTVSRSQPRSVSKPSNGTQLEADDDEFEDIADYAEQDLWGSIISVNLDTEALTDEMNCKPSGNLMDVSDENIYLISKDSEASGDWNDLKQNVNFESTTLREKMNQDYKSMKVESTPLNEKTDLDYKSMKVESAPLSEKTDQDYKSMKVESAPLNEKTDLDYKSIKVESAPLNEMTDQDYKSMKVESKPLSEMMNQDYKSMKVESAPLIEKTDLDYKSMKVESAPLIEKTDLDYKSMKVESAPLSEKTDLDYKSMKVESAPLSEKTDLDSLSRKEEDTFGICQEKSDITEDSGGDISVRLEKSDVTEDNGRLSSVRLEKSDVTEDNGRLSSVRLEKSDVTEDNGRESSVRLQKSDGREISVGVVQVVDPIDDLLDVVMVTSTTEYCSKAAPKTPLHVEENDHLLKQEDTIPSSKEISPTGVKESSDNLFCAMNAQGETHGDPVNTHITDNRLDDMFDNSTPQTLTSAAVKSSSDAAVNLDNFDKMAEKEDASSSLGWNQNDLPEVVEPVDCMENVTLKDAREKALLGSEEEEHKIIIQNEGQDSSSADEKRKSGSDMDFSVLELDSSYLNLDFSKQKSSLRKKGSLARRKKPTRSNVNNLAPETTDNNFTDTTDSKTVTTSNADKAEDDVDIQTELVVQKPVPTIKPTVIMPGLQELSKSKLFNQERIKTADSPSSPTRSSPLISPSQFSPSGRGIPPLLPPKPSSKLQKDSKNMTIAAENSVLDLSLKPSTEIYTSNVLEETVVTKSARTDSTSSSENSKPVLTEIRPGRTDSWSSVSSPRKLSRGDSVSSVEGGEGESLRRRPSIQGSAYAPIGFRPRRSASLVLDSSDKLIDSPALPSPSPSSTTVTPSFAKDFKSVPLSGLKSSLYKPPVWLSEMKAKTGSALGASNDADDDIVLSSRSRNCSESSSSLEESGAERRNIMDEVNQIKQNEQAAMKKTSLADNLQIQKEDEVEKVELEEKQPVPPWAEDLKKKNPSLLTAGNLTPSRESSSKISAGLPSNHHTDFVTSGDRRVEYSPSWMKKSQKSAVSVKVGATNGSPVLPASVMGNRMKAYETPKWKLELAEKRKKREAEMTSSSIVTNPNDDQSSTSTTGTTVLQRRLSQLKKRPTPEAVNEADSEGDNKNSSEWTRQAEERRVRLMKSGLFGGENADSSSKT